jgi:hypothetical protein
MSGNQFFDKASRLDTAIIESGRIREYLDDVVRLIGDPALRNYFFNRLESPEWLQLLNERGFFAAPPQPVRDDTKGTITFPRWPESRYLARMAGRAPETVLEVALQIPDTENISVHEDLADAALSMPANFAAVLAAKEARWIEQQNHLIGLLPNKLGELITHLAEGGMFDVALDLTRRLLIVLPDPKASDEDDDSIWKLTPEPVARIDQWDYEVILKKNMPSLVAVAREQALRLLCELLESAITLSQRQSETERQEDYSYIWRRGIEHTSQSGLKDLLVSAVRDAAQQIVTIDAAQVPAIIGILESHRWLVFKRLALHLLRFSPDYAGELITEHLIDKTIFDQPGLWHEYILLAKDHFSYLTSDQQNQILSWIDAGKDREIVKAQHERWDGEQLSDEAADLRVKYWKLSRLKPLYEVLPDEWRRRYDDWAEEVGEPEHADYITPPVQVHMGFGSPKTSEDLRSMSVEDIASFLQTWKRATDDPLSPSPEGLGRELTTLVASEPNRFATEAGRFKGLDPIYTRFFISGIRDAVKLKKVFLWSPVISLCQWVMSQPRELPTTEKRHNDEDNNWGDARSAIAELLSSGFESSEAEIPFDLRSEAWGVLRLLTEDPEPTPEYEERYGGLNMDPMTLSINTTRGEAMHAVVRYALWVQRHIKEATDGAESAAQGFDEMPEVREVLDSHLDPSHDPSLAIHAVYGLWVPWLITIDSVWVNQHLTDIFPVDERLRNLRNAAWETYIVYNGPYNNIFEVLRDEYGHAVERIGEASASENRAPERPENRLAEHLMIFYGRGIISLDSPQDLLARFYEKAPDKIRAHALWLVGRDFRELEAVPHEVLDRFQVLWQHRFDTIRTSPRLESHTAELKAFGWLFSSMKFDDTWAIVQLRDALKLSGWADHHYMVVEYLATLSNKHPALAIECLDLMVEGDKEGWGINRWGNYPRTILVNARQSANENAQEIAVNLINRLGARGYLEYRNLL